MLPELSPKQRAFLEYLRGEITHHGKAPSLRQTAAALGVSHSAVVQYLKALEEKGYVKREGRYSRNIYLLNRAREVAALQRWREIPVIGRCTAGLPMYAQQELDGTLVVDAALYHASNLFALRVKGDSMVGAGILDGDLAIFEPRQYARNGEIVVALIGGEEATVKRFFLKDNRIELRPENSRYRSKFYEFGEVLIQGKMIGIERGPEQVARL
ncbi:MAG: transcriptional repressor LexA [Deltaproteobacteria bacterium]|nr:transcriptional repressor LexA [Deltaproteobacteria bacterium]